MHFWVRCKLFIIRADTLIGALAKRDDVRELVTVSNNAGAGDVGLGALGSCRDVGPTDECLHSGKLLNTQKIDKLIASYPGGSVVRCLFYEFPFECICAGTKGSRRCICQGKFPSS